MVDSDFNERGDVKHPLRINMQGAAGVHFGYTCRRPCALLLLSLLAIARLTVARLTVARLAVARLTVARLTVTGLAIVGLTVARLTVASRNAAILTDQFVGDCREDEEIGDLRNRCRAPVQELASLFDRHDATVHIDRFDLLPGEKLASVAYSLLVDAELREGQGLAGAD